MRIRKLILLGVILSVTIPVLISACQKGATTEDEQKQLSAFSRSNTDKGAAFASERALCPGEKVPSGWVIIRREPCVGRCGDIAGQTCAISVIQNLNSAPSGFEIWVYKGSTVPSGWGIVGVRSSSSASTGTLVEIKIKKLKGMEVGTEVALCPGSPVPNGWNTIGTKDCDGDCGDRPEQVCFQNVYKKVKADKEPTGIEVGASYGGGVIISVDATGQHGVISSTMDQSDGTTWANAFTIAAECRDGGFSNWRLPTQSEIQAQYANRDAIGNFSTSCLNFYDCSYWTADANGPLFAWNFYFTGGHFWSNYGILGTARVRAVRSF